MRKKIYLYGDGWGAIASYKGLSKNPIFDITVVTNDEELKAMATSSADIALSDLSDAVILFDGYKPFVPKSVLEKNVCINIHPSLLPRYRGMHSTVWAILNDEPEFGFTIHLMNEFMDDGDIIFQKAYKNDYISTSTYYMEEYNSYKAEHLDTILLDFLEGRITPRKQDKSQASWVGRRNLLDCKIDFNQPIAYQKAFFRSLVPPYPRPYVVYKGVALVVKKVFYHTCGVTTHNGRILNIDNDGLWVKLPDGYMVIQQLEYCNGNDYPLSNFRIGQRF